MLDAMKKDEMLKKLKEKLGKNERLYIISMKNFERIENVKTNAILSEGSFGKHRIKRLWLNLNSSKTKRLWPNLNLGERLLGLNSRGRI